MALGNVNSFAAVLAAITMGGITLASHGSKASARVLLNVISPLEGASNIAISTTEDVIASSLAFFSLKAPYLAMGLALVVIILVLFFALWLTCWALFTISLLFHRMVSWFSHKETCDELPNVYRVQLGHMKPDWCLQGFIQNLPGIGG